jgi:dienelactone hydrolase
VAVDAEPARCALFPLAVFSHGDNGSKTQSAFLTETLARKGYIVAAVDHADANGRGDIEARFREPENWNADTYRERGQDIRQLIDALLADAILGPAIDVAKIAGMGHSLGGYTIFGLAGGWESWYEPRIRAVLGLSPYLDPYLTHNRVPAVTAPKMYQSGATDLGILPSLRKENGVYDQSSPGKFFAELRRANHLEWTNAVCGNAETVARCLATQSNAGLIVDLSQDFLNFAFTRQATPLLRLGSPRLADYRTDLVSAPVIVVGELAGN